jgi:hypothetical protein
MTSSSGHNAVTLKSPNKRKLLSSSTTPMAASASGHNQGPRDPFAGKAVTPRTDNHAG